MIMSHCSDFFFGLLDDSESHAFTAPFRFALIYGPVEEGNRQVKECELEEDGQQTGVEPDP